MTEIWMVCGAVPVLGATDSQAESLPALKARVPLPILFTFAGRGAGSVPPAVALKVILAGDTDKVGGDDANEDTESAQIQPEGIWPVEFSASVKKTPLSFSTSYQPEEHGGVVVAALSIRTTSNWAPTAN